MLPKEYSTISNLSGPLMVVEKIDDVRYDELAEIRLTNGERRRGRINYQIGRASCRERV